MLHPTGDSFKVELTASTHGFVNAKEREGYESGIVVEISERATFFGKHSYAFDSSLMDKQLLSDLYDHYKQYVGKKVIWGQYAERGSTTKDADGKLYAFILWSDLLGWDDGEEPK